MQETISKHMLQKHTQTIYEWAGPQLFDCTTTALGSQGGDYSEGKLGNQFVSWNDIDFDSTARCLG